MSLVVEIKDGDLVDVQNEAGKWCLGQIVKVTGHHSTSPHAHFQPDRVFVHWPESPDFDRWIDLSAPNNKVFAAPRTLSSSAPALLDYKPGEDILVKRGSEWIKGTVDAIEGRQLRLVLLEGSHAKKQSVWVHADLDVIVPIQGTAGRVISQSLRH